MLLCEVGGALSPIQLQVSNILRPNELPVCNIPIMHIKKRIKERDVWLRGGEKERMHGDSILSVGGSRIYERTSKANESFDASSYQQEPDFLFF
jgi:hypothetical protein